MSFPQVTSLNFQDGNPATAYAELAADRTIIINGPFASTTGLKVGDTVKLTIPEGEQTYRIIPIGGDYLNAKLLARSRRPTWRCYVMITALTEGGYPVTYSFPLSGLLGAIAIGLLFGVLAAILPARQATRTEIVAALHYE